MHCNMAINYELIKTLQMEKNNASILGGFLTLKKGANAEESREEREIFVFF